MMKNKIKKNFNTTTNINTKKNMNAIITYKKSNKNYVKIILLSVIVILLTFILFAHEEDLLFQEDTIIRVVPKFEFETDIDIFPFSIPAEHPIEVSVKIDDYDITLERVSTSKNIYINLLQKELSKSITKSVLSDYINYNILYIQYPEKDFFPDNDDVSISFAENNNKITFEKTDFSFKDFILIPYKNNIKDLIIKNSNNITFAASDKVKHDFGVSKIVSNYLGKAVFEILSIDEVSPLTTADVLIKNSYNEVLANLSVNDKGFASTDELEGLFLFENYPDNSYRYEVLQQNQLIASADFDIDAPYHLALNEFKIITSQKPIKNIIGQVFDLKGRLSYIDHNTNEEIPLNNYKLGLYNRKIGTFSVYARNFEKTLIQHVYTDENGYFIFEDILNVDGRYQQTIDALIVLYLENDLSKMVNSSLGSEVVYKQIIFSQSNIRQFENKFDASHIRINIDNESHGKLYVLDKISDFYRNIMKLTNKNQLPEKKLTVIFPTIFPRSLFTEEFDYDRKNNRIRLSKDAANEIIQNGSSSIYLSF